MSDEELSRVIAEHVYPGHGWENQYRDMMRPKMTLLLLDKLRRPFKTVRVELTAGVRVVVGSETVPDAEIYHDAFEMVSLGRAVAEAYAKANGLVTKTDRRTGQ